MGPSDRPAGAEQARDQGADRSTVEHPQGTDRLRPFDLQLLDSALSYAARGWPVFPLARGTKLPAEKRAHPQGHPCRGECGRIGHGFHDATVDPAFIAAWWDGPYRGCNVGIATGYRSGLWVLDVDPKHGGDGSLDALVAQNGAFPPAPFVTTPSGGTHYYYRRPAGPDGAWPSSQGRLGRGLDVRADGGYVVAPPSVIDNAGQYHGGAA